MSTTFARIAAISTVAVAATLFCFFLPSMPLDGWFAVLVVRLTDSAVLTGVLWTVGILIVVVVGRSGLTPRRRIVEVAAVLATLILVGAVVTLVNEHGIKPLFGSPRPNIVLLAESGALGPDYPDANMFYALGGKDERREVLDSLMPEVASPPLADSVRAHWAHETGYAFPSGHSTAAMTLATTTIGLGLAWLVGWRRVATVVIVPTWAVLIGFSRVLLQVHRPIDVVAGSLLGLGFGLLVFALFFRAVERFAPS